MSTCPVCGKDHDHEVSCADQPKDSRVGQVICGKYRVTRLIGEGGMASVYEARHTTIDRPFALKFLHPWLSADEEWLERFSREGSAGGALVSEHISAILDVGLTPDEAPYILMEFLRGEDLGQRLAREGTLKPQEAIEVITQACHGLAVAHRAGVIHRDLKPENIFLCNRELGGVLVKVLDFGIAKLRNAQLTRSTKAGMVMGTPYYMSPEQAAGRGGVDHRSDLYSLGVMLYELLSGEKPFVADDHGAVLNKIVASPTPLLSELCPMLSADLAAVVQRAIAKDASDRFQTAEEFADALLRFWPQTRQALQTASAFSLSRARRRTEDLGHITSVEPRLTVRVTGTRNAELSPLGVLKKVDARERSTTAVRGSDPGDAALAPEDRPTAIEHGVPEFADCTEPDALLSLEDEAAMRSPQTRDAPPKPERTPVPELGLGTERQRQNVGRYRAANSSSEPPPVNTIPYDDTPVPTSVQSVSLGRTLAPLLLGAAAIVLVVAGMVSRQDSPGQAHSAAQVEESRGKSGSNEPESELRTEPEVVEVGVETPEEPETEINAEELTDTSVESEALGAEGSVDSDTSGADPEVTTGTLSITSTPRATLRVEGKIIGRTPKYGVELPVGSYRLELWHDALGSTFKSVKIHEGVTTSVNVKLKANGSGSGAASAPAPSANPTQEVAPPQPAPQKDPCKPSYYLDAKGVRRIKPHCL